ncbi:hypothetical protein HGRIS_009127 [Hohenbuehelia grisea]|uniref:DUF6533 domain-containing protein n=1 Tax=Hohenbuehelia grisea TaxID=104357 RepID=A0ABR3J0D1_9AGAR
MSSLSIPLELVDDFYTTKYIKVSAYFLVAYDYTLTLSDELEYIWPSPWSIPKGLFFLTRYVPMVGVLVDASKELLPYNVTMDSCGQLYKASTWLVTISICFAEAIMAIRVWALWGRPLKLAILLGTAFTSFLIAGGVVGSKFATSHSFYADPGIAGLPGCLAVRGDTIVSVAFICVMVFETLTFGLTIAKGLRHPGSHHVSSLAQTMLTDGAVYFATLLIVTLVNVVLFLATPADSADIHSIHQMALHSILSARVLIHLRKQSAHSLGESSVSEFTTNHEGIVFAHGATTRGTYASRVSAY